MKKIIITSALLLSQLCSGYTLTFREKRMTALTTQLYINVTLEPNEVIYQKELILSADDKSVLLSPWTSSTQPAISYDPFFKEQRSVFDQDFTLESTASLTNFDEESNEPTLVKIHLLAASNKDRTPHDATFTLSFSKPTYLGDIIADPAQVLRQEVQEVAHETEQSWKEWSQAIKTKISLTESWLLRLLLVFLLGVLLSLTPCIYPMIPITVGILQSQGTSSLLRNFLLSLCYAVGLGTTFAIMGLIAASSGQAFGHLMGNPIFVCSIVALLCYFAFSLFGFYQLYIPRFLQGSKQASDSGSALSIFLFGLASGTFASPCLSPGLVLVLALVASIANKLLGFLLLFAFGLGISTPLVIIGTFSSSIALLPRAGMWMLEVQKIFGFLLIGMCFYYLSAIVSTTIILCLLTAFFFVIGIYYLHLQPSSLIWRVLKNLVGTLCMIGAFFVGIQAIQETYYPATTPLVDLNWYTTYEAAAEDAQKGTKKVLIDFATPYCSICSAITKTILQDPEISKILLDQYILVAVDASDNNVEPYKTLQARYDIQGVPTILIVDPADDGKQIKRWTSELYGTEKSIIMSELKAYTRQ